MIVQKHIYKDKKLTDTKSFGFRARTARDIASSLEDDDPRALGVVWYRWHDSLTPRAHVRPASPQLTFPNEIAFLCKWRVGGGGGCMCCADNAIVFATWSHLATVPALYCVMRTVYARRNAYCAPSNVANQKLMTPCCSLSIRNAVVSAPTLISVRGFQRGGINN